jgi:hypothetical protein
MDAVDGDNEEPTREVLAAGSGDRCANCAQPLASDQRYCIDCGERRGAPRFSFSALAGQAASAPAPAPAAPRRRRLPDGIGFIAGVATLLLAMGVGVLIGHNNSPKAQQAAATPPQQVIKIEGGGSSAPTNNASTQTKQKTSGGNLPATHVTLSKKQTQAVNKAVNNVLGQGSQNLAPPTIQPGQSCTHGAGCQGGKFTGNFFGGGQN